MRSIGGSSEHGAGATGGGTLNLIKIQTTGAPTKSALKAFDATGSRRDPSGDNTRSFGDKRASTSFEPVEQGVPGAKRKKEKEA